MPRKSDDIIKGFIGQIGAMIDARSKTLEVNLKAYIDDVNRRSDERYSQLLMDTEKRIRKDMATKDDIRRLEQKIDKTSELQQQIDELNERIRRLEKSAQLPN